VSLRMVQITTGQWRGESGGLNFSVIGLDDQGDVYRFETSAGGWVKYPMVPRKRKPKPAQDDLDYEGLER